MRQYSNDEWTVKHVRLPYLAPGQVVKMRPEGDPEWDLAVETHEHYMVVWRGDAWPTLTQVMDGIQFARRMFYIPEEDEDKHRYVSLHNTKLAPGNYVFGIRIES